ATAPALPDLPAAPPARAERPAAPRSGVDLNSADAATLAALPGVGPVLAQRILASRQAQGPFRAPEDLLRVPGLGPARLVGIRPHLVGAGTP
ncbi:MAG: helix-hairpin-helix domain-containing protein, partial [Candidatus Methylomirabilota bacterium]